MKAPVTTQSLSVSTLWEAFRLKVMGRKFVRDAGVLTLASFFTGLAGFLQNLVVARWLGPEIYGTTVLVIVFPSLVFGIFDARTRAMAVKFLGESCAQGKSQRALAVCKLSYFTDLGVSLLSFLVILGSASLAGSLLVKKPGMELLMVLYAAGFIPKAMVGTSASVLSVLGRFPTRAVVDICLALLRTGLILGFVLAGWGVAGVIWGHVLGMAASGIVFTAVAYPLAQSAWGTSWIGASWGHLSGKGREIFRFLLYTDLGAFLGVLTKQLDVLVLGYLGGPRVAGYYKLAVHMAGFPGYLVQPLDAVTYPRFARMAGSDPRHQLGAWARRVFFRVGLPLGILFLAAIPLLPWLVELLFGPAYLPATLAAQILLLGQGLALVFYWVRGYYMATGNVSFLLRLRAINAVLAVLLYPLGAAVWGSVGVAVVRVLTGPVLYLPAAVALILERGGRR